MINTYTEQEKTKIKELFVDSERYLIGDVLDNISKESTCHYQIQRLLYITESSEMLY